MGIDSRAPLDRSPRKNEVERRGGLPMYIRRIANHLHQEKGMSIGHAIAVAKNAAERMCATGDLNWKGRQNVNPGSRAEACAAIADWNTRIKGSGITKGKGVQTQKQRDADFIAILEKDPIVKRQMSQNISKSKPAYLQMDDEEFDEILKEFGHDDLVEISMEGEISKVDTDKGLVFGWASVAKRANGEDVVDKQGDVLEDIDAMENVAYDFVLHSRDGGEMHVRKGVSTLVESFVSTPEKWQAMGIPEGTLPVGWWVGFQITDPEVKKAAKEGKYRMFSVHGSGTRKAYDGE